MNKMNAVPCFELCFKNPLWHFAKFLASEWAALKNVKYPCYKRITNPYAGVNNARNHQLQRNTTVIFKHRRYDVTCKI